MVTVLASIPIDFDALKSINDRGLAEGSWLHVPGSFADFADHFEGDMSSRRGRAVSCMFHRLFLDSIHGAPPPDVAPSLLDSEIAGSDEMDDYFPVVVRERGPGLPPRKVQEIRCSRCGAVEERAAGLNPLPPHTVAAKFAKRGWKVGGVDHHLCPACRPKARAAAALPQPNSSEVSPMAQKPAARNATAPAPAPAPAASLLRPVHASPKASSAITDLYMMLADQYDHGRKAYREGWDDERMARETGLALAVVQERRERDFGPLVRDTTREDLARALDLSAKDLRRAGDLLDEARTLLTGAQARHDEITKLAAHLTVPAAGKAA